MEKGEDGSPKVSPWLCSCRLGLAITAFFGLVGIYAQRSGMSVAIVCMVNHTALRQESQESPMLNTSFLSDNGASYSNDTGDATGCVLSKTDSTMVKDGPFLWGKEQQGHLLGAFFYGYLASQVPAGMLAERFGGKWVFSVFYLMSTLGTILTPVAAEIHYGVLILCRVFVGIGSGAVFPVLHSLWGRWAPPNERSKIAGVAYAGTMMGNVIALPLSGILCEYGFAGGWASIFYVCGMFSLAWCLFWMFFVGDSPAQCKRISAEERNYITHSLKGQISEEGTKQPRTPWLKVFKSGPVWAIIVCNFATDWGLYTYLTNIPTYMFEVLKFDMQSNGFFSALPFIALWLNMTVSPLVADKLITSSPLSVTFVRKLLNSIGMFGSAILLVGLGFIDCTQSALAIALLAAGVGISGSAYSGFLVNHMDIAPAYAGSLFGLTNCIGACSGFIAPYVAAVITANQTREEWQVVFFITAGLLVAGNIIYLLLGTATLQPWALEPVETAEGEVMKPLNVNVNGNGEVKDANGEVKDANGLQV